MKEEMQCELQDLLNALHRFTVVNKNCVAFVGGFIAFDEEKQERGEDPVKDFANRFLAYGNKESLRTILNDLRDMIEDEAGEDDFVNI